MRLFWAIFKHCAEGYTMYLHFTLQGYELHFFAFFFSSVAFRTPSATYGRPPTDAYFARKRVKRVRNIFPEIDHLESFIKIDHDTIANRGTNIVFSILGSNCDVISLINEHNLLRLQFMSIGLI